MTDLNQTPPAAETELPPVTVADITNWYNIDKQLKALKGTEAMLRTRIAKFFFPTPTEGSKDNKYPMNKINPADTSGAILQMDYTINRNIDEAQLAALKDAINAEGSNLPKELLQVLERVIKWKPELNKGEYNKLDAETKLLIDRVITAKPGMPGLEVKIPKRG